MKPCPLNVLNRKIRLIELYFLQPYIHHCKWNYLLAPRVSVGILVTKYVLESSVKIFTFFESFVTKISEWEYWPRDIVLILIDLNTSRIANWKLVILSALHKYRDNRRQLIPSPCIILYSLFIYLFVVSFMMPSVAQTVYVAPNNGMINKN